MSITLFIILIFIFILYLVFKKDIINIVEASRKRRLKFAKEKEREIKRQKRIVEDRQRRERKEREYLLNRAKEIEKKMKKNGMPTKDKEGNYIPPCTYATTGSMHSDCHTDAPFWKR